jgi:nucleoid-associated protein YgaU
MSYRGAVLTILSIMGLLAVALAIGTTQSGSPHPAASHSTPVPGHAGKSDAVSHSPRVQVTPPTPKPSQGRLRHNPKRHRIGATPRHVRHVTVKAGDTLWSLSHSSPQHPLRWVKLWHHNPQVKNPSLIHPGEVLKL